MLLDIHSHRPAPYPEGIISAGPEGFAAAEGQLYSMGLHPWYLPPTPDRVEAAASALAGIVRTTPQIVAIGEAGFDTLRGAPMMLQTLAFRRQVELSEELGLPMVIHAVRTLDMIAGWRRETGASQPWIVHGYRGKPQMALQLVKAGCGLSFGPHFNADTLRQIPAGSIFAETDDSDVSIGEVIAALGAARGEDLFPVVEANMRRLFGDDTPKD